MDLNFDKYQYLFQIPKEWFQSINNICHRSYPGWLIHIKDGDNGGKEIFVDYEEFKDAVEGIAGPSGGTVKSVDGHLPDVMGEVSFNLTPSKWVTTDANGHLTTSNNNPALSVDGVTPDSNGEIDFNLTPSKWVTTDTNGHLTTDSGDPVFTVDGITPDSNGNIDFNLTPSKWLVSDTNGNITTTNDTPVTVNSQLAGFLFNNQGVLSYIPYGTLANTVAVGNHWHGAVTTDGYINIPSGKTNETFVITDSTGKITTTEEAFKTYSNVSDYQTVLNMVKAFNWSSTGTPSISGYVKSVNSIGPDAGGNVSLPCIYTVNNRGPDTNGNIDVNEVPNDLTGDKWVKTDSNGNLITTDADPVTVDSGSSGFLFNNAGTLSYIPYGNAPNTVAVGNHTHNTSQLNNDAGFITTNAARTLIEGYGYVTDVEVEATILSYGYQTESDVNSLIDDALEDYVTLNTVQTITANKFFGADQNHSLMIGGSSTTAQIDATGKPLHITNSTLPIEIMAGDDLGTSSSINLNPNGTASVSGGNQLNLVAEQEIRSISEGRNYVKGTGVYLQAIESTGQYENVKGAVSLTDTFAEMRYGTGGWIAVDQNTVKGHIGAGSSQKDRLVLSNTVSGITMDNSQMLLQEDSAQIRWTPAGGGESKMATIIMNNSSDNKSEVGVKGELIVLDAPANSSKLWNAPTVSATDTTSLSIATCGWVADNFTPYNLTGSNKWVKTNLLGKLVTTDEEPLVLNTSSVGFVYDNNGTASYIPFGNGPNTVAVGNHTHNTSQLNNDAGFITTNAARTLIESYNYTTPTDVETIVESYGYLTEADLDGYVTIGTEQNITGKKIFGTATSTGLEIYGDNNANHLHFNRNLEVTGLGTKSFNVRCYTNQGQEGNMGLYAGSYTQFFSNVTAATIMANAWAAMRISDGNGGYPVGCYFDNTSKTARIWSSGGYSRMSYRNSSGADIAYLHIDETYCGLKHGTGGMLQVDGNGFEAKVGSNTYIEGGNAQLLLTCGNTSSPSIQFDNSINTIWLRSGSTADDSRLTIGRDGTKGALSIFTPYYTYINGGGSTGGYVHIQGETMTFWGGNATAIYAGERIALQWGSYPHVWINSSAEIQLNAPANQSKLYHHPTVSASDTNSYAIATCGWVADNFIRSEGSTYTGTRTVVTGVSWTGTQLQFTRENWKYTKGQLESVSTASTITINTTTYP